MKKKGSELKTVASNRKARHLYHIEETYEVGIALTGCEVKSIREGKISLQESYARFLGGELWLVAAYITPFEKGSYQNPPPTRNRKLLLNKAEIRRIRQKVEEKGYTLVPLKVYFNRRGLAKLEIAVARGKKLYDRREAIRKKFHDREIERAMKPYR